VTELSVGAVNRVLRLKDPSNDQLVGVSAYARLLGVMSKKKT